MDNYNSEYPRYLAAGDRAITVEYGNIIDRTINAKVLALKKLLEERADNYIELLVPSYRSLTVFYNPLLIDNQRLSKELAELNKKITAVESKGRLVEIPVCYDEEYALDIVYVADYCSLTVEEVIERHIKPQYLVYMLGFIAGFPYLGEMDKSLYTPRKSKPRLKIEQGSVGIAAYQTGIYSLSSPGGWQIIGRTPLDLFDSQRENPFLLKAGDQLKFVEIDKSQFLKLKKKSSHFVVEKPLNQRIDAKIKKAGALTTIQDEGRLKHLDSGLTEAGAFDKYAYRIANLLVGNELGAAALEFSLSGADIEFYKDTLIALSGADFNAQLNGQPLSNWQAHSINAGDRLSLGYAQTGVRGYLAVAGGINVETVLASRSTDLKAKIGGYQGRKLESGDTLSFFDNSRAVKERRLHEKFIATYPQDLEIRVVLGQQSDYFTKAGWDVFLNSSYTISSDSNRMGYRLEGQAIEFNTSADIISDAVVCGSIQVSNNGQPMIMLVDHQSTGGYAKIATVISEDIAKLAQARVGSKLRFKLVTVAEAEQLIKEQAKYWQELEASLNQSQSAVAINTPIKQYNIKIGTKEYRVKVERTDDR